MKTLVLALSIAVCGPAAAQNGLYSPAPVPVASGSPMAVRGLMMARDSVFDVDSVLVHQYEPPAIYGEWFEQVQMCSGLKGSLYGWTWTAVPGDGFLVQGHGPFPGYTAVEHSNFLVLRKYIMNEKLVQHEMLHALLWQNGRGAGHPAEFDRCELQAQ